ncbi:MAG: SDR family oxidoreductase [Deltaproteobacteria bacterium]|nr:SDR family oxidoreductase [Deltaproteobacteria bacterium]
MSNQLGRGAVVVTGASTGIGEACAVRLERAGYLVFVGVRKEKDAEAVRAKGSERLRPLMLDITDGESIRRATEEVAGAVGDAGLAGLINNAGVGVGGPLEFVPLDQLRWQLEVNVIGQIAVTQAFLELIRKAKGRVIFVGSASGRMSTAFAGPYSASKFALESLTDALRGELRPWGIEVCMIEPGRIATPIWDKTQTMADDAIESLPARGKELYGEIVQRVTKFAVGMGKKGIEADHVARAAEHAMTAPRPRTRYAVGADAKAQIWFLNKLPDRWRDGLISLVLNRVK